MHRIIKGDVLFGLFMVMVFVLGAYDLFSQGDLSTILQDSGLFFALFILAVSVVVLCVVIFLSITREEDNKPFISSRGMLIAATALLYPLLFWAVEYLISTFIVAFITLGLFTEQFGRKQLSIAFLFATISYLIFFFLLGITEPNGAVISIGLNNVMSVWRRDFFSSF